MSVSTRTAQQPLGIGQLGTALVVVALAIVIAATVAFSMAAKKAEVIPAAGGLAAPAFIDHGSRDEFNTSAYPGLTTDPGFAPRSTDSDATLPRVRNQ